MTVSNIRRMSKSFEVEGGGTAVAAAAGLTDSSALVSPVKKRRRCDTRGLNPRTFRASSHLSSPLPKKVATESITEFLT